MICEGRQFEPGREHGLFFFFFFYSKKSSSFFFLSKYSLELPWRTKEKKKKQVPVTYIKRPNSYLGVLETFSEKSILNQGDF